MIICNNISFALRKRAGFTLAEVLVALIILAIAAGGLATTILSINLSRDKAYKRAKAIEIASTIIEENLAKSYSELDPSDPSLVLAGLKCITSSGQIDAADSDACFAKQGTPFKWALAISESMMNAIPYKQMQLQVSYNEAAGLQKTVSLVNYVEYPYIHTFNTDNIPDPSDPPASSDIPCTYAAMHSTSIDFRTRKNIQISYNIAIRVITPPTGPSPQLDTIYTKATLVPASGSPIAIQPETRTPILTQPLINNWTEVDHLAPGTYQFQISWYKCTAGTGAPGSCGTGANCVGKISAKMGSVVIIAAEDKQ